MESETTSHSRPGRVRVLIVDDSALVRRMLRQVLEQDAAIEVVGTASNGAEGLRMVETFKPDVVTLDVTMPVMDGLTMLRRIMAEAPLPCVMVSALTQEGAQTTITALQLGAVDFVPKPGVHGIKSLREQAYTIVEKVKAAAKAKVFGPARKKPRPTRKRVAGRGAPRRSVVAIGASTGGPKALMDVVPLLPGDLPVPVLIVQHMPGAFTGSFASRMDEASNLRVKEAEPMETMMPGRAYLAPGGIHMRVGGNSRRKIILTKEPEDALHRPSVDVLMESVVDTYGGDAVGVLLTGMGADGAEGMLALHKSGGVTIAQDEQTSTIFGMPKEAIRRGAARRVLPIEDIAEAIVDAVVPAA